MPHWNPDMSMDMWIGDEEPVTFLSILLSAQSLPKLLIALFLSLVAVLIIRFSTKTISLFSVITLFLFGSFIGFCLGAPFLMIYFLTFLIMCFSLKFMQLKSASTGIVRSEDFRLKPLSIVGASLFPSFMAYLYFMEVNRPRDCMGMEFIFIDGIILSLSTLIVYYISALIDVILLAKGRGSRFTFLASIIISIIVVITFNSIGRFEILRYINKPNFFQPLIIVTLLVPGIASIIANNIRKLLRLRVSNMLLMFGLTAVTGWIALIGEEIHSFFRGFIPPELFFVVVGIIIILLVYFSGCFSNLTLFIMSLFFVFSLFVFKSPFIIPVFIFAIIESLSYVIGKKYKKIDVVDPEGKTVASKRNHIGFFIIAFVLEVFYLFTRPEGYIFYAGIVLCFSVAVFRSSFHYIKQSDQPNPLSILILGGVFSFITSYASFTMYMEPITYGMFFFIGNQNLVLSVIVTFLSILINNKILTKELMLKRGDTITE